MTFIVNSTTSLNVALPPLIYQFLRGVTVPTVLMLVVGSVYTSAESEPSMEEITLEQLQHL